MKLWVVLFAVLLMSCTTIIKPYSEMKLPPKNIIFTFDDGPNEHSDVTVKVLDVLKSHGIHAYFCVVGKHAEKNPEIIRRMHDEGHIIANHSYSHPFPAFTSDKDFQDELDRADAAIGKALGQTNYRSIYIRPPFGVVSSSVKTAVLNYHYRIVNVSVLSFFKMDSEFSPRDYSQIIQFYKESLEKDQGGMIVMHDGTIRLFPVQEADYINSGKEANRTSVPEALEELIRYFSAKGYTFDASPPGPLSIPGS